MYSQPISEDEAYDTRNAPHARRDGPWTERGRTGHAPEGAQGHGDRHTARAGHGRTHPPAHVKRDGGGGAPRGGAGWAGPEKAGLAQLIDETAPLDQLEPGSTGGFAGHGERGAAVAATHHNPGAPPSGDEAPGSDGGVHEGAGEGTMTLDEYEEATGRTV